MGTVSRKILIAMDGSKHSDYALDWYLKNFYRENDFAVVVYCAEHGALLSAPVPTNDPSCISKLASEEEEDITKLLKSFQERLLDAKHQHPNLKSAVQRLSGRKPGQLIVEQAEQQAADMILTGARGLSSLRKSQLGSVSTYIMQHSGVPVLLIRLDE